LTQTVVAAVIGTHQSVLSLIERRLVPPSAEQRQRLAAYFEIPEGELLEEVVLEEVVVPVVVKTSALLTAVTPED
jgi:transcriptional regulator with XRE-family HTH domain